MSDYDSEKALKRRFQEEEELKNAERQAVHEFRPGIYQHYKGARYTALMLGRDHHTRRVHVIYVPHSDRSTLNIRPLVGPDGWVEKVPWDVFGKPCTLPRFVRLTDQPEE